MTDYTDLKLPDRVWAWGSELMGEWDLDPTGGTEYIRADIHAAAIAALEAERDAMRVALGGADSAMKMAEGVVVSKRELFALAQARKAARAALTAS